MSSAPLHDRASPDVDRMINIAAHERRNSKPDLIGEENIAVNPYKRKYTQKADMKSSLIAKATAAADSINS